VPAADLAGRPDLTEKEASRLTPQFRKLVGDITYIHTREGCVYPAGRDETTLLEKNCWLRHSRETCEPNWSKTLCKIGGSELPAHQGCDNFSCRVRGSQHTSADYTATMNKYGIHRIGGKNRRVPRTAPQQISFNATRAGKNSSTSRIYHTRRKAIKDRGIMD